MEYTGAIAPGARQYLDKLQVEVERGITVKAQTVSLVYRHPRDNQSYLLNLIDTPGHVDFSYEVSRSLSACQGCVLLVDATQGVQAQTVANFFLAFDLNLAIVPVLNKIDMPAASKEQIDNVVRQLEEAFEFDPVSDTNLRVSAKTGEGVEGVLDAIVTRIPPPPGDPDAPTRMLLFDAYHDEFRGVVCQVAVVEGGVKRGDRIVSCYDPKNEWEVNEVGVLCPEMTPTTQLLTGQVGYVLTGMKNTKAAQIGDTWHIAKRPVPPISGFKEPKSMVFAGIFPVSASGFEQLQAAMQRLTLNDASVAVKRENSAALGAGFRCGFLGLLHMDVFRQRLEQEHGASVIVTAPTVPIKVLLASSSSGSSSSDTTVSNLSIEVENPSEFPTNTRIACVYEPTVRSTIIVPTEWVGAVMTLCQTRRGELLEHSVLGSTRAMLRYNLPLAELGGDFYDELKSSSSGYASFDYEQGESRPADLVRLDILINGEPVDALARIIHRTRAESAGRVLCEKLKAVLDRQQFDVVLQAAAGGRVVARETIKAYRKNVLAKCYGGDVSRKRKLLEKQKEGKKKMRKLGSIDVPADALHSIMRAS